MSLIRRYITMCKRKLPVISPELSECIVNAYVKLPPEARRNHDLTRNLLGILRLLITLSLPRLADEVYKDDVQKALLRELAGANKTAKILDAMERCPIIVLFVFYLFHPVLSESTAQIPNGQIILVLKMHPTGEIEFNKMIASSCLPT
ncbi:hypothetical protein quinque_013855 [Culex quinquefasciatus]